MVLKNKESRLRNPRNLATAFALSAALLGSTIMGCTALSAAKPPATQSQKDLDPVEVAKRFARYEAALIRMGAGGKVTKYLLDDWKRYPNNSCNFTDFELISKGAGETDIEFARYDREHYKAGFYNFTDFIPHNKFHYDPVRFQNILIRMAESGAELGMPYRNPKGGDYLWLEILAFFDPHDDSFSIPISQKDPAVRAKAFENLKEAVRLSGRYMKRFELHENEIQIELNDVAREMLRFEHRKD